LILDDPESIYAHIKEPGDRRRPCPVPLNMSWGNESFRGYDYMETEAFEKGIESCFFLTLAAEMLRA